MWEGCVEGGSVGVRCTLCNDKICMKQYAGNLAVRGTMQYTIQYITVYHSTSQYTTVHHSILYSTSQYTTVHRSILYSTSQYTTVHHSIPQYIYLCSFSTASLYGLKL